MRLFRALPGEALLPVAIALLQFAIYHRTYPEHDSYYVFQAFKAVYESLMQGAFPAWLPRVQYGVPAFVEIFPSLTPAQYAVGWLLAPLGWVNVLIAFHASVALEILVFLTGTALLAGALLERRAARVGLVLSAGLLCFYQAQIWYNLRVVELLPLLLFFVIGFARSRRPALGVAAALTGMLWLIGNVFYFLPVVLLLLGLAGAVYVLPEWRRRPLFAPGGFLRDPWFAVLAALAAAAGLCLILIVLRVFWDVVVHSPLRGGNGRIPVEVFLTYGRNVDLRKFAELLLVLPHNRDSLIYAGYLNLAFAVYAVFCGAGRRVMPLLVIGGVFTAMSLPGLLPVARLLYAAMPGMDYYRHVGLLMAIPRFFLLLTAAVGIDLFLGHLADPASAPGARRRLALLLAAVAAAGVLLYALLGSGYMQVPLAQALPDYPVEFGSPMQALAVPVVLAAVLAAALVANGLTTACGPTARRLAVVLPAFLSVELLSYATVMYWANASDNPREISSFFKARPPEFRPTRLPRPSPEEGPLIEFYGSYYPLEAMLRDDRCIDVGRRDARTPRMAMLIEARGGVPVRPFEKPEPRPDDLPLLQALGCETPKLRLTGEVRLVGDEAAALAAVRSDPDFGRVPVVVCPPGAEDCTPVASPAVPPDPEPAAPVAIGFGNDRLTVRAEVAAADGAWLVYAGAWATGWSARVDGVPVPVRQSDVALMAVRVPAGVHEVAFRYAPPRLLPVAYHGLMLIALVLAPLAMAGALRLRRRPTEAD